MIFEKGFIKRTDKYKISNEDKLIIQKEHGRTCIYINNEEIHLVQNYKLEGETYGDTVLEVTKIVPYDEVLKDLKTQITIPKLAIGGIYLNKKEKERIGRK